MSCTFLDLKVAVRPDFQNSPSKKEASQNTGYLPGCVPTQDKFKATDANFKEQNLNKKPNVGDHTTTKAENPSMH